MPGDDPGPGPGADRPGRAPRAGRNSAWAYHGEASYDFNVGLRRAGPLARRISEDTRRKPVWAWSPRSITGAIQIVAPGLFPVGQQGGSWSVYYNFDQYVYTEPELRRR